MARFVFKLRGVLRQRKHVEQEKMRALAQCLRAEVDCQAEIDQMNEAVKKSNDDLRNNHLVGVLDMSFLAAHRRFMISMQRQSVGLAQKLAIAQQRVAEARAAVVEASRQRKVIEKLRDKQLERWRAEQAAKEMRDLDEIGMQLAYQAAIEEAGELAGDL